ncbi:MAG: hypothetical protein AAGC93_31135 [Cyanobacteria bacterium P01_F01_bin.53]
MPKNPQSMERVSVRLSPTIIRKLKRESKKNQTGHTTLARQIIQSHFANPQSGSAQ